MAQCIGRWRGGVNRPTVKTLKFEKGGGFRWPVFVFAFITKSGATNLKVGGVNAMSKDYTAVLRKTTATPETPF